MNDLREELKAEMPPEERMRRILYAIAWPRRGSWEDTASIEEIANEIQENFEQSELEP